MDTSPWIGATAKDIARAVRRGDTSATQVVADHLDHIRAHEARLGALRAVRPAEALAEAEQVDKQEDLSGAWLAGVPVVVKEYTPVAGLPVWHGSAATRGPVAEADHEVVRRLRGAGAVVVGTSRMPEFGLWATTDDADGVARNPWHRDRTPGGSSGGAAAAVAAGLVPVAHGTDGLGSVRIPAACCGLVGLKPGRGVVPRELGAGDWFGLVEHGVLATTVADAAVTFAVLAGQRPQPLTQPGRLRVAVSVTNASGLPPDAANRSAVTRAGRVLAAAGHDLRHADPGYPVWFRSQVLATWFAGAEAVARQTGADLTTLQARTQRHVRAGRMVSRLGHPREADRQRWRDRSLAFLDSHDLLLTPALATAPPVADAWHRRSWQANLLACLRFAPYTAPWNVAGLPALAVPVGTRPDGLPLAVQLVGRPGSERQMLAVAGQLEEAAPWPRHAPGWPRWSSPAAA